MKIRIEIVDGLPEEEVVIRCAAVDERVQQLQKRLLEPPAEEQIVFYKDNQEFFFSLTDVLFFETEGEAVYAHTAADAYRIKHRLYELEEMLPAPLYGPLNLPSSTLAGSTRSRGNWRLPALHSSQERIKRCMSPGAIGPPCARACPAGDKR